MWFLAPEFKPEISMRMKIQNGFTLVEIAIVLVIVGLLIGGVLKGQEMITNAKLKRIESEGAGLAAAMFSYQDRYLQLPGDDSEADTRFTVYDAADSAIGNGNGTIDGAWDMNTATVWNDGSEETLKFFAHLRAAGLIPGGAKDATRPTNAYGGQIGIQNGALGLSGHVIIFGAIEGPIAKIIEARLDDGDPTTGSIQAGETGVADAMSVPGTPAAAPYDDAKRYDLAGL
jgi:prepilin-type N-terminal cleavage/methylation domain-containing protein